MHVYMCACMLCVGDCSNADHQIYNTCGAQAHKEDPPYALLIGVLRINFIIHLAMTVYSAVQLVSLANVSVIIFIRRKELPDLIHGTHVCLYNFKQYVQFKIKSP